MRRHPTARQAPPSKDSVSSSSIDCLWVFLYHHKMLRQTLRGMVAAIVFAPMITCGHGEQEHTPGDENPPVETGPVSVLLVDAELDGVEHIWVTIERIDLRPCDGGGWLRFGVEKQVDLLALRLGKAGPLLTEELIPSGSYCEARLVTTGEATLVFDDGSTEPVVFPSGQASGIKIKSEFEIRPGVVARIVLDFDASESFIHNAGGKWIARPTIRTKAIEYISSTTSDFPGSELIAEDIFTVYPDTESVWELEGGSRLSFPIGSVASEKEFTVRVWSPPSDTYEGYVYEFGPEYTFENPPAFISSNNIEGAGAPTVFLDGVDMIAAMDGGELVASIPHFSNICVDESFSDVDTTSDWYPFIAGLRCRGVIEGRGNNEYEPDGLLKRSELLKIALELAVGTKNISEAIAEDPDKFPMPFNDVPESHWARDYIRYAYANGLISGDNDEGEKFRPEEYVNRAEAAKIFVEASELYADAGFRGSASIEFMLLHFNFFEKYEQGQVESPFSDVDTDVWFFSYAAAIRAAHGLPRNGLFSPVTCSSANFCPSAHLPRQEMAFLAYLTGSGFNGVRRRLFCSDWMLPLGNLPFSVSGECIDTLSNGADLNQMYLAYWPENPTKDKTHAGLDFNGSQNIYAPVSGTVTYANQSNCGGVIIEDQHVFLHMTNVQVSVGQEVTQGDLLGTSSNVGGGAWGCGPTGSFGAHLHYEILRGEVAEKAAEEGEEVTPVGSSDVPRDLTYSPIDFLDF